MAMPEHNPKHNMFRFMETFALQNGGKLKGSKLCKVCGGFAYKCKLYGHIKVSKVEV